MTESTDNLDLDALAETLDNNGELPSYVVAALITAASERDAVVEAVRGVHGKSTSRRWAVRLGTDTQEHYCIEDQYAWPCPTIEVLQAIDGGAE